MADRIGDRRCTHGLSSHPFYGVWCNMRTRCSNRNHHEFCHYGGRGITVCERWQTFENFRDDMLPGYRKGLTLERKDNDVGYFPENCYWATRSEQQRNKRNNRIVDTPWGAMPAVVAAERSGVRYGRLLARLNKGWPWTRALMPPHSAMQIDTPVGRLAVADAAVRSGLSESILRGRVRIGWPTERLFAPLREADRNA